MLIAQKALEIDKMRIGQQVYLGIQAADSLTMDYILLPGLENYKVPSGMYSITNIQLCDDIDGNHWFASTPYKLIHIHHKTWDPEIDPPIEITYTKDSKILVANNYMTMENGVYAVFNTIQDLVEINKDRWECAACGKKLNLPMGQMRICFDCETILERLEKARKK